MIEAVDKTVLFLAVTPNTSESLLVSGRIPVRIEEDKAIGADEVETTATGFGREQENELLTGRVVEFLHELLALVDVHGTIKSKAAIPAIAT